MKTPPPTPKRRPRGSVKALADGLGITRRAVSSALLAGMPDSLPEARQWRLVRVSGDDSAQTLRRERILLVREQRERAKLENEIRRGEMIPASEVQEGAIMIMSEIRGQLLKFAAELPPQLFGETCAGIQKKLRAEITAILKYLSDEFAKG